MATRNEKLARAEADHKNADAFNKDIDKRIDALLALKKQAIQTTNDAWVKWIETIRSAVDD